VRCITPPKIRTGSGFKPALNLAKRAFSKLEHAGACLKTGPKYVLFELDMDSSRAQARPNACTNTSHSAS
jgi:hypothetical protein